MDKRVRNGLFAIVGIVLVSVCVTRGCAFSETVADYAENRESDEARVMPTVEAVEQGKKKEILPSPSAKATLLTDNTDEAVTPTPKVSQAEKENEAENEATPTADAFDAKNSGTGTDVSLGRIYAADDSDFYIEEISDELKERMKGKSYAYNIDESVVNYSALRHIVIKYNDFNNEVKVGEIVCNEKIASDLLEIFEELFKNGYQLEHVQLIDEYGADDDASMAANNTSCFNYRVVEGSTKLSYHAYGLAIDVNPFYNPYVQMRNGSLHIDPPGSEPYANRDEAFPYKIDENDLAYKLFKQHGFIWGGDWNSCKDYQHFEKRLN